MTATIWNPDVPISTGAGQLRADLLADHGSQLWKFLQAGVGAVPRLGESKLQESISIKDFGAVGDGVTDDTAAIQLAINAAFNLGGAIVTAPPGIFIVNGTVSCNFTSVAPISISGAGPYATRFKRSNNAVGPIFSWSSPIGILNNYSVFNGFSIDGNNNQHDGIALTNVARFSLQRIRISGCAKAINNAGSLVYSQKDCTLESNLVGVYARSANGIFANFIDIHGGQISSNAIVGLDIGTGQQWMVRSVDMSANGTPGDPTTGAVIIRSTVVNETGYANFVFEGGWFEQNKGTCVQCEAAAGINLTFRNVPFYGSEAGRVMNIPAISHITLENIIAASAGDTVTLAASYSLINGCTINVLADTSTYRTYNGSSTSAGALPAVFNLLYLDGPAGNNTIIGADNNIGGGSANDLSIYHYGAGNVKLWANGAVAIQYGGGKLGFYGVAPVARPNVTGSRAGNVALASLLTNLASEGLITDGTTA